MINIKYKYFNTKFYAENVSFFDVLKLTNFNQYKGKKSIFELFYKRKKFITKVIDLTQDFEYIKKEFSSTVKNENNRASREGVNFSVYTFDNESKIDQYVDYYNTFAESKRLHFNLSKEHHILPFIDYLIITQATYNNCVCAMHGYIIDYESRTAYLAHSSSHFRLVEEDSGNEIDKNFIGRANRFLHVEDIKYFKKLGFTKYDLGGYGYDDKGEPSSISKFKDGFGGILVQEDHLEHKAIGYLRKIKGLLK